MKLMNNAFSDWIEQFLVKYLADILIYSETCEEHFKHIWIVLQILRENMIYRKLSKCIFEVQEVIYSKKEQENSWN